METYSKNVALGYASNHDPKAYSSLRHLVKELQIRASLTMVLSISFESRQNLVDEILLERDSRFKLKMHAQFPNQVTKQTAPSGDFLHRLDSNLVILKLVCCQKISL